MKPSFSSLFLLSGSGGVRFREGGEKENDGGKSKTWEKDRKSGEGEKNPDDQSPQRSNGLYCNELHKKSQREKEGGNSEKSFPVHQNHYSLHQRLGLFLKNKRRTEICISDARSKKCVSCSKKNRFKKNFYEPEIWNKNPENCKTTKTLTFFKLKLKSHREPNDS